MFKSNQIYRRSQIHDKYGGSRQSGISPSAKFPFIFIFSGSGGEQHGYKDRWENDKIFSYTGEGQVGDMTFTKGNLALKEHLETNKRVFLFEYVDKGMVMFNSELDFYDFDYFETHDRNGDMRIGIKFFFKKVGVEIPVRPYDLQPQQQFKEPDMYYEILKPDITERKGLVTSRVGQGAYRKSIIHRWQYKCAVTGFDNTKILIASHIVPWKNANDKERLDVHNGILLSPTFDALFDRNMISFNEKGKLLIGKELKKHNYEKLGVNDNGEIKGFTPENQVYLERHRSYLI